MVYYDLMENLRGVTIRVAVDGEKIVVSAGRPLSGPLALEEVPTCKPDLVFAGQYSYVMSKAPVVALSLREKLFQGAQAGASLDFGVDGSKTKAELTAVCSRAQQPTSEWDSRRERLTVSTSMTPSVRKVLAKCKATPMSDGRWSVPVSSLRDFLELNKGLSRRVRVPVTKEIESIVDERLPEPYDGTAESLKKIPVTALRTVRANAQAVSLLKADRSTIAVKLGKMGVTSLYDLLMLRPRRYIDRSDPQTVDELIEGETATIVGVVREWKKPSPRLLVLVIEDKKGVEISCSFFNTPWLQKQWQPGDEVVAVGKYKPWRPANSGREYPQLNQPIIDRLDAAGAVPVMPVYSLPGKAALSSAIVMHCEQELISRLGDGFKGPRWADPALKANHVTELSYGEALKTMHLPTSMDALDAAQSALAFCELVELLTWIESRKKPGDEPRGVVSKTTGELTGAYKAVLPYALTGAQERAVESLAKGMGEGTNSHSLLVGDVGSGKTTVMHLAALMAVEGGHQAVVCAPTEILARQLYDVFMRTWEKVPEPTRSRVHAALHAGYKEQAEGLKKKQEADPTVNGGKKPTAAGLRRALVAGVADGSINLVFGTHAVLNLEYGDLGFVGVDEQQKFGAAQRSKLLSSRPDGLVPDMLMQTATPIPRSIAQVYYGDVQYVRLDEMPAGRQPITTRWVKKKGQDVVRDPDSEIWRDVVGEARRGHGTFVVCPMVADSEKTDAASVKKTMEELRGSLPGDVTVSAVYGGQAKDKQDAAILGFRDGTVDVLVASTVVEVGVSCENATRMVVLDANRFGIASLHQIRGRIGRSDLPSTCWLVAMPFNETASRRLQAMVDTLDGWKLSKTDLKNRGAGSLFGDRQSGESDLMFADLVNDARWIGPARKTALDLLAGPEAREVADEARKYFGLDEGEGMLS